MSIVKALMTLLLVVVACVAQAELRGASWNVRHLGWDNDKDLGTVARVIERFDVMALQGVMGVEPVEELERRLETASGESWTSITSAPIGRSSYKEHYAILWRESEVSYLGGAVLFADHQDIFAREPLSGVFADRDDGTRFVFAAVHILYGESVTDRTPEIRALDDYWDGLESVYEGTPIILAGDFNLSPGHLAWAKLRREAEPLIVRGATTLSERDGDYANLYDNLWVSGERLTITSSGIARFPEWLGVSHRYARAHISDHAPVYFTLGAAEVSQASVIGTSRRVSSPKCVDLNTARAGDLVRLIHVGESRAKAIVAGRPWASVEALTRVRGIGPAHVADIRDEGLVCGAGRLAERSR